MSLTKLLMAPIKLFKKDVITFLIIRRYDLGLTNDTMRYIAVKPSASVSVLRQKVWHLLDLPDYCEEVITLCSPGGMEIALTALRRGNDPQHPYILEVWPPGNRGCKQNQLVTTVFNNMITFKGDEQTTSTLSIASNAEEKKEFTDKLGNAPCNVSNETMAFQKPRPPCNLNYTDFKKSDLSCKVSRSSLFRINGRKSQDNFASLLLKIQTDLSTLNTKLTVLENKISH